MKEQIEIDLDKACTLARQLADEGNSLVRKHLLFEDRRRYIARLLAEAAKTILQMSRALLMLAQQAQHKKDRTVQE